MARGNADFVVSKSTRNRQRAYSATRTTVRGSVMAMMSEAGYGAKYEGGKRMVDGVDGVDGPDAVDGAERAERAERAEQAYRGARLSLAAAKGTMLAALGTLPLVAAYHIDFGPEIAFEIDLGTVLWATLAPCALGCWLNGLRLLRTSRRLRPAPASRSRLPSPPSVGADHARL
jgi:hypothetical protein